ncbi:hypothetical protein PTSG_03422 [Salpingoeca rosetta]|uniref:General transcription factor IIH subunit 3 n=1 Tax=Salpingoeca rosetta (strain ATCC 50818 / BSB-021) TaxID=946362 RepID=F2U556_SALR5|nr:uncharacterized protein PTSG_03422 [Salpingoeca rosetta]EGD82772.1 hypothetical protein PTSG_03422 [Salpingoeca rosetta]|eukprot:XP_004996008.1 hypothetical protein PTSG_03422 [Salpingoeca rosetta]
MSSLFVLIVDLHPARWKQLSEDASLDEAMNQICVFLNAQLSVHVSNTIAVIGAAPKKSMFLYPSAVKMPSPDDRQELFSEMNATILANATKLFNEQSGERHPSDLAGALSKALCFINRTVRGTSLQPQHTTASSSVTSRFIAGDKATPASSSSSSSSSAPKAAGRDRVSSGARVTPRIGVVSVSPDSSVEYFAAMNCIFAAQKNDVPIDVCAMGEEAAILQQAAHLTNGTYVKVHHPSQLLQSLMMGFVTSSDAHVLVRPVQRRINFDASCFCHGRTVDIGYVCTVCLSVYCERLASCRICGAEFSDKPGA